MHWNDGKKELWPESQKKWFLTFVHIIRSLQVIAIYFSPLLYYISICNTISVQDIVRRYSDQRWLNEWYNTIVINNNNNKILRSFHEPKRILIKLYDNYLITYFRSINIHILFYLNSKICVHFLNNDNYIKETRVIKTPTNRISRS